MYAFARVGCVRMYTHVYARFACVYMHDMYASVHVYMRACVCMHVCTCMCGVYVCVYMYVRVCVLVCMFVCMCEYVCIVCM